MIRNGSLNFIAIFTLAGFVTCGAARAETPRSASTEDGKSDDPAARRAIAAGCAWLKEHQNEDGSWSNPKFPALSGLALWALANRNAPADRESIEKAIGFLRSCARENGGIYVDVPGRKGGGLSVYNTAICLSALHATGRAELNDILLRARAYLAESQYLGGEDRFRGGFGYDRETNRAYTDMMNTHFALEAMRRTQDLEDLRPAGRPTVDIDWDAALEFVSSMQDTDSGDPDNQGGFAYSPGDPKAGVVEIAGEDGNEDEKRVVLRSYGSISYAGLLSLVHARLDRRDPRVRSVLDWAARHWTLAENPGMGDQGLFFFFNVLSRSLNAAGVDRLPSEEKPIDWRAELVDRLVALQHPDGSWTNPNGRFWENDPTLCTAYTVLALQFALKNADF